MSDYRWKEFRKLIDAYKAGKISRTELAAGWAVNQRYLKLEEKK